MHNQFIHTVLLLSYIPMNRERFKILLTLMLGKVLFIHGGPPYRPAKNGSQDTQSVLPEALYPESVDYMPGLHPVTLEIGAG